jgi:Spy/CpxP family protein refolding chaperone
MRTANAVLVLAIVSAMACDKDNATTTTSTQVSASATTAAAPSASASASPMSAADEAADEQEASEQVRTHHRHHHHGGVAMFVHMAMDTLGVAPEKKAQLEKIQSDLFTAMAPARDASKNVMSTLADQVAAGTIDKAKVDAAVAKEQAAAAQVHGAAADALNALHGVLSPVERQALADKVEAHATVWKKVNTEETPGSKDKGTHLARMTDMLGLSGDQVDKISTALKKDAPPKPDVTPIDGYVGAFVKAFPTDTFDAKTFTNANAANSGIAKHGLARMVHFYETVTPLLTPDQRTKLAAHLRERLNDHTNGSK